MTIPLLSALGSQTRLHSNDIQIMHTTVYTGDVVCVRGWIGIQELAGLF